MGIRPPFVENILSHPPRRFASVALLGSVWLSATPAAGLIVDPAANARPLLTPPVSVLGTWGFNGAAVAIGPNHVLTTRHQDGVGENPATRPIVIDGVAYNPVGQTLFDPGSENWDVRVVEIARADNGQPANLTDFVPIYTRPAGESLAGQRVLLSGPGVTGTNPTAEGFDWQPTAGNSANPNNDFGIRFGENRIESTNVQTGILDGFEGAPGWVLDFDAPNTTGALPYEATVGPGDSGGGLLMFRYDQWWLVGLTNSVEEPGFGDPDGFFGQDIFAIDVTGPSLVSQIESAIGGGFAFPEPKPLPEPGAAMAGLLLGSLGLLKRRR